AGLGVRRRSGDRGGADGVHPGVVHGDDAPHQEGDGAGRSLLEHLRGDDPARGHPGRRRPLLPQAVGPGGGAAPGSRRAPLRAERAAGLPAVGGAGPVPDRLHQGRAVRQPHGAVHLADRGRRRAPGDRPRGARAGGPRPHGHPAAQVAGDRLLPGAGDDARRVPFRRHHRGLHADARGQARGGRVLVLPGDSHHGGRLRAGRLREPGPAPRRRAHGADRHRLRRRLPGGAGGHPDDARHRHPPRLRPVRLAPHRHRRRGAHPAAPRV
ncbi:MAG: Undecaprenyl-diphosphatase, partial [uncultured Gemmatimonadetes bacterium]